MKLETQLHRALCSQLARGQHVTGMMTVLCCRWWMQHRNGFLWSAYLLTFSILVSRNFVSPLPFLGEEW